MAQLFFKYSTMNAGKSLEVLKVAYNYEERNKKVLLLSPLLDAETGTARIKTRLGLEREAIAVSEDTNILEVFLKENQQKKVDCVIIDESQFLLKHHVEEIVEIVDSCNTPVLAFGLKNDFKNELFEGSYYLLVNADKIEEIKTICWCGRKATMIGRVEDGRIIKQGEQKVIGGLDLYVPLCRKHYNDGRISPNGETKDS